jgi:hypothetical protein
MTSRVQWRQLATHQLHSGAEVPTRTRVPNRPATSGAVAHCRILKTRPTWTRLETICHHRSLHICDRWLVFATFWGARHLEQDPASRPSVALAQATPRLDRYSRMKLFSRENTSKRSERAHNEHVTERMKSVLSKDTQHADAETVETRIRNMNYGSSRR